MTSLNSPKRVSKGLLCASECAEKEFLACTLNITKGDNVVDLNRILRFQFWNQKFMPRNTPLTVGEPIPSFELFDQDGQLFSSETFKGKPLVIFFYPKDHTPGCTAQACSFRDHESEFAAVGAQVIGVNSGSVKEHKGFVDKYKLNFPVLSDPGHKVRKSLARPGCCSIWWRIVLLLLLMNSIG